jgi:hypothetical protein
MANEPKKCAHEGCTCVCTDGKKYCSSSCEQQTKAHTISLGCDCPHPGCKGHL